jgi:hypothetical protein
MPNIFHIASAISNNNNWKFINHSTASVIELVFIEEDGNEQKIWMDWSNFDELVEFIKTLQQNG